MPPKQPTSPRLAKSLAKNLSVREEIRSVISSCETANSQLSDDTLMLEAELALEALSRTVEANGRIWLCGNGFGLALAIDAAAKLVTTTSKFECPTRASVLGLNGVIASTAYGRGGQDDALGAELINNARRGDSMWCFAADSSSKTLLNAVSKASKDMHMPVVLFSDYPGTPLIRFAYSKIRIQPGEDDRDRSGYCIQWAHAFMANILCNQLKRLSRRTRQ